MAEPAPSSSSSPASPGESAPANPAAQRLAAGKSLTPMLRHYLEVKAEHPDALVFYRMGDFYEMFFEDAQQAAPVLEVTLTARHKGTDNEVPMCGVPHHALESYLAKAVERGFKVALCEQVEDPAEAKGLVERRVVRVVTPGTLSEPELLEGKEDNLLAAVTWDDGWGSGSGDGGVEGAGAGAFLDVSTGHFFVRRWARPQDGVDDLRLHAPREVIFAAEGGLPAALRGWIDREAACPSPQDGGHWPSARRAVDLVERQLEVSTLRGFGLEDREPAVTAAAAALAYARDTQQSDLEHIRELAIQDSRDRLVLDPTTLANLEVFRSQRGGGRKGTLVAALDRTATAPGGRTLRDWLRRPLRDPAAIGRRHRAVRRLVEAAPVREALAERLSRMADPERLLSRAVLGSLTPREAASLRDTLAELPELLEELDALFGDDLSEEADGGGILADLRATDPLAELAADLTATLEESPAASIADGGVIAEGVDPELDEARSLARDSKRHILAMEAREREATGIGSLKIRYNKVFGYYLEVTKANVSRVPEHYIRKQTLVNAERYITPEIKELEDQILSAEERQLALEERHYRRLVGTIAAAGPGLAAVAEAVGTLDVLTAFAETAVRSDYAEPVMGEPGGPIVLRDGRHPVVERTTPEPFVPNDLQLGAIELGASTGAALSGPVERSADGQGEADEGGPPADDGVDETQIIVLTGPNMGGKSTYLRQVALIVLMAQAGSFVPAASAEIGVVDRIFTRVGASDDLARGESTFMVEMIETANILHHATSQSLVILDEVGRGTATFDGLSLAWAIVEHLHGEGTAASPAPKTLFATHYHELTELASLLPRVVNRTLAVREWQDRIVFLRRVIPGSANKSYGIQVARLAGLPPSVLQRAGEILGNLESQEYDLSGRPRLARGENAPEPRASTAQLNLFVPPEEVVASVLRELDIDQLTPLAALNLLHSLQDRLFRPGD